MTTELGNLSVEKRALLAARLRKKGPSPPAVPAIPRLPRDGSDETFPLSFAQERLWLLEQMEPGGAAYCIPFAFRMSGALDRAALERALNEVVRRHEVLRATFRLADGCPVQVLSPHRDVPLPCVDLRRFPPAARDVEMLRVMRAEAQRTFDLERGPLMRAVLLRPDDCEHVLFLTVHHIVVDAWSAGIFGRELAACYRAFFVGFPVSLPELPLHYVDFAAWQRSWLQGETLTNLVAYWEQQLRGTPPVLDLPADHPRPPGQSYRGATYAFALPGDLAESLRALSRRSGVTLFMTLLAAFDVLLYRYTGQADVVVGTPTANRNRAELAELIGFFVNTLVLRCDLSGNPTFRELLGRVRETALGAFAHQDMPFEVLVETLHPARDPSRNPLFQVMFILQNVPKGAEWEFPELTLSRFEFDGETAQFDLLLTLSETESGLSGKVTYNCDLYDAGTAARMAGHYQTLLAAAVANPDERLLALPLLTGSERENLHIWNSTTVDYSRASDLDADGTDSTDEEKEKIRAIRESRVPCFRAFAENPRYTLHELFEAQAARTPDAPAVIFEGHALTYAALDRRSNTLAHRLRALGVGPETLVGVCMERSLEMVVALYGILEAGGAYVPLDPAYPKERLAFMLGDAQPGVLLAQSALLPSLPAYTGQVLCLDRDLAVGDDGDDVPAARVSPDNLAYMIYTSGSTGRPKGALNTHRAIANRLLWMQHAYGLTPQDRVLQKTPFSFDVSVWEFFWPLITGACLVLARPEGHKDNAYLVETIRREGITTLHFVPSMLRLFLAEPGIEMCRSLRRVICSGEALPLETQTRFFERMQGSVELHNLYGPTEAAVDVTAWRCERDSQLHTVPIGRPIANLRIHLLDARMQPVPVGVPGELYIGGVGVARGYHRRPGLTAEKFVPDPFSDTPGQRLYRTGDLARYLPSGAVEFLQRLDDQVKVRGFRIELGEIETTLQAHPAVAQAAVTTYQAAPGDKRLVAYVVLRDGRATVSELRAFLGERLPGYMVPSIFMLLDTLPLSPNGKLDRRALPAPEGERPDLATTFVAPRNDAERTLVAIWQEVLGLERVGVHDNFFELGGDSLLTLRVLAKAKSAGLSLTPRQFFQNQTVAALAAVAGALESTSGIAEVDSDASGIAFGALPLTPGQAWFFHNDFPDPHWWTMGQLFRFKYHPSAPDWLREALRSLLEHHDGLRARFTRDESGWRAWIPPFDPEAGVPLTVVDFSAVPRDERPARLEALAAEAHRSLNLAEGPPVRLLLVDSGAPNPYQLLVVLHHLVSDEVSLGIVLQDLWAAYAQLAQEQPVTLPPQTTPLRQWSARLHAHVRSADFAQQMAEWQALPWPEVAPLPLDDPGGRRKNTWDSLTTVWSSLTDAETSALLHSLPRLSARPLDALLAALVGSVGRWTGKPWVAANLIDSGRLLELPGLEDADLSRTVGWLAGGGILLLERPDTGDTGTLLRSICEQVRRFPAQGIPIELARLSAGAGAGFPDQVYDLKLNYAGRGAQGPAYPAWVRPVPTSMNNTRNPACLEPALLTCAAAVMGNRLCCAWNYSRNVYRPATIEALSADFMRELREILEGSRE